MMGSLEVSCVRSVEAVCPQTWRQLSAGHTPFHQLAWFRSAPPPGELRMLVARRGERVVGVLALYFVDEPTHYYHSPRDILCGARERALIQSVGLCADALIDAAGERWSPCAIAMSPHGYRSGVICDACDPLAGEVMSALIHAADRCCREANVSALFYYGLSASDDAPLMAALTAEQATPFVVGAHCELHVTSRTIDEYFAALGERGRRMRSKYRQAERNPEVRWRCFSSEEGRFGDSLCAAATALFCQSARDHGDPDPPAGLYRAVLEGWPGTRHLLVGESAGAAVRSALLILEQGSTLYPKFFGARSRGDYFHLAFYRATELAMALGAARIAYGGGSHAAKLLRGAGLAWLFGAVVPYDCALARALQRSIPVYTCAKQRYFSELAGRYAAADVAGVGLMRGHSLPGTVRGVASC